MLPGSAPSMLPNWLTSSKSPSGSRARSSGFWKPQMGSSVSVASQLSIGGSGSPQASHPTERTAAKRGMRIGILRLSEISREARSLSGSEAKSGVSVGPGHTQFTWIEDRAASRPTDLLNAMMPLESSVAMTADSSFPAPWLRDR